MEISTIHIIVQDAKQDWYVEIRMDGIAAGNIDSVLGADKKLHGNTLQYNQEGSVGSAAKYT